MRENFADGPQRDIWWFRPYAVSLLPFTQSLRSWSERRHPMWAVALSTQHTTFSRRPFAMSNHSHASQGTREENSIKEIVTQAHSAWDLKQLEVAAGLFRKASVMEKEAATGRAPFASPDMSFPYAIRSALCLWDFGRHDEARPVIEQALTFDWASARVYSDGRMTEWAFVRLLVERAANQDRPSFLSLWQKATLRGEQLR